MGTYTHKLHITQLQRVDGQPLCPESLSGCAKDATLYRWYADVKRNVIDQLMVGIQNKELRKRRPVLGRRWEYYAPVRGDDNPEMFVWLKCSSTRRHEPLSLVKNTL